MCSDSASGFCFLESRSSVSPAGAVRLDESFIEVSIVEAAGTVDNDEDPAPISRG